MQPHDITQYIYEAKVMRVVDGDTVDLEVDLGFKMKTVQRFRLTGIDAPEVRGPEKEEGKAASEWLLGFLSNHETIYVKSKKTGKFGRWLGTLIVFEEMPEDQGGGTALVNVNERMVALGYAEESP